jgi:hypothetical protein
MRSLRPEFIDDGLARVQTLNRVSRISVAEWLVEMVDHMDRAPPLPRGWKSS